MRGRGRPQSTQWANFTFFSILPMVVLMPILEGEEWRTRSVGAAPNLSAVVYFLPICVHVYLFYFQKQIKSVIEQLRSLLQYHVSLAPGILQSYVSLRISSYVSQVGHLLL